MSYIKCYKCNLPMSTMKHCNKCDLLYETCEYHRFEYFICDKCKPCWTRFIRNIMKPIYELRDEYNKKFKDAK